MYKMELILILPEDAVDKRILQFDWLNVIEQYKKVFAVPVSYSKLLSGNLAALFRIIFKLTHVWEWLTTPITIGVSVGLSLLFAYMPKNKNDPTINPFQPKSNDWFLYEMQRWVKMG